LIKTYRQTLCRETQVASLRAEGRRMLVPTFIGRRARRL
jgi:hypothetical protein